MTEQKPGVIWLVCPKCKSRYEVRAAAAKQTLRCQQCRVELRAIQVADADDLLGDVDPDLDLPVAAAPTAPVYSENVLNVVKNVEPPPLPSQRRLRPEPERKSSIDEEYRPPKFERLPLASIAWAFFSNTFTFPFMPYSLMQWMTITATGAAAGIAVMFVMAAFLSGQGMNIIGAGFVILPIVYIGYFALAYAAACMDAILVNAAYQMDDEQKWPDPDHRERVFCLLRWGFILTLVVLAASGVAILTDLAFQVFWPVFWSLVAFLFPIALLSSMETASLSVISLNVWRSVVRLPHVWFVFYAVSGAIGFACGWLAVFAFKRLGLLAPLAVAPACAAAALIYGRLLGRLAWCFLKSGNAQSVGEAGGRRRSS
jgi:hypothetical protein